MTVVERIRDSTLRLTPAERRVAEVLAADPSSVAFGTVASLAGRSSVSGPSVLRLAAKLGFEGFVDLQAAVQAELAGQLRPATERIRAAAPSSPLARARSVEARNVEATLDAVDDAAFERAVRLLADRRHRVHVLSGEASAGVAAMVVDALDLLRPGIATLGGSDVAVARQVAGVEDSDVVLALELRRYERWVLATASSCTDAGATVVAVTDQPLSPLAEGATEVFLVTAVGAGPFDSHVGTLALGNALVAGVAARLRTSATARLDAVEAQSSALLV